MAELQSPPLETRSNITYRGFLGINRVRDRESMENPDGQPLWALHNAYCDSEGNIVRDPPIVPLDASVNTQALVQHVRFHSRDLVCWAEEDQFGQITLKSERAHTIVAHEGRAPISSVVHRGTAYFFAPGLSTYKYDGGGFYLNATSIRPAFGTSIQQRMYVSGDPEKPTEVLVSRARTGDIFPNEEDPNSTSPLRAAFIDVSELVDTGDVITGLASFETNRLVIFTNDQTIVYAVDPDRDQWTIDNQANLRIGCIGHNTIKNVEGDIIFASRHGVHSMQRSRQNGISIIPVQMSRKIEELYRNLVATTPDARYISAVYDQDEGNYHIFFPRVDGSVHRLTCHVRGGYENLRWSQGLGFNARCADALSGRVIFGTKGGLFVRKNRFVIEPNQSTVGMVRPQMRIEFPVLWHGNPTEVKQSRAMSIMATGKTQIRITSYDHELRMISSQEVSVEANEEIVVPGSATPLSDDYKVPFAHQYKGVILIIESIEDDIGDFRMTAINFSLKERQLSPSVAERRARSMTK